MEDDLLDLLENWELASIGNAISLAIVGKTGNGKSATGNSILGRQAFISDLSPSAVTCTSELKSTMLKDGRYVHVIDTPGLFAFSNGSEFDGREIVKCIDLAKDGLHAILMVFSINSRFTTEEAAAIQSMKTLFGDRIVDYMIVVFTGGDTLEVSRKTLNDYISRCPEPLKNIILLCKNRVIVFDNKTEDKIKRERQVKQLISLVDSVVESNGGKPFSSQIFAEVKEEALRREQMEKEIKAMEKEIEARKEYSAKDLSKLKEDIYKSYDDQLKRLIETVEQKLNSTIEKLENQLAEEQVARLKAEEAAEASRLRSYEEIQKVKDELNRAREESQEFRNKLEAKADKEQVARLKAEKAAKASRLRSDEEIQKLKDELNRAREESREFRNKLETMMLLMEEHRLARVEEAAKSQLLSNAANIDTIVGPESVMRVQNVAHDPTSPCYTDPETLARLMLGQSVPTAETGESSAKFKKLKTKKEIERAALVAAANLGMIFDPVHLEDLVYISSLPSGITDHSVWMYLRGVMRTNEISVVSTLSKITSGLEGALAKTQHNSSQNVDSNRIMLERLAALTLKVDDLGTSLVNNIKVELAPMFSKLNSAIAEQSSAPTKLPHPPADVAASSKTIPANPWLDEVNSIYSRRAGVPVDKINLYTPKFHGLNM